MEKIYFGGYTRNNNKGIHIYNIDADEKSLYLDKVGTIEEGSPTFIARSDEDELIFSITTREDGGVASYSYKDGDYVLVDTLGGMGKSPCHLYWDKSKRLLYSSNYHLGKLDVIKVDDNGKMKIVHTEKYSGKSIISPDQDSSKCHMAIKDRDDRYLIVIDLGDDSVYSYEVEESGKLIKKSVYKTVSGMGPRHIAFGKNGEYAYLIGELNSEIQVLSYDKEEGVFTYISSISTLPEGFEGVNTASAVKCSSDGNYLYASNRGDDSIAIYKIGENGELEKIEIVKTGGKTPRDFGFSENGAYMFIGHQNDEKITVFNVDKKTGKIHHINNMDIQESEIVCVMN